MAKLLIRPLLLLTLIMATLGFLLRSRSISNFRLDGLRGLGTRFSSSRLRSSTENAAKNDGRDEFYITTPIYYVNGEPHLGHAYTSILSDIVARYQRSMGKKVFFLTGTDEHGQKVEQSASNAGKSPIVFADEVSARFRELVKQTGCSNDDFIRTTEPRHMQAVTHLWNKLLENNQIYLGTYEGWYSIRDEAFYAESELVDGKAPTGASVEWVREESYFFRLSQYTDKLLKFYEENPDFISPKSRRNEVVSFVSQEGGLKDLSISRTTFSWGIPVPNDPKHVIYVWLDALANYISALGYPQTGGDFQRFWPADLHVVGKDILRFHAVFWPAFLMAADLPLPKKVFAHGWWTKDGEKMSKSLGNVLDPFQLLRQYGVDYVRYFLCTEIQFGNDGDFSHEAFVTRVNSELANDLGNLLQRAMVMMDKNCQQRVPAPSRLTSDDETLLAAARSAKSHISAELDKLNLKTVAEHAIYLAKLGNKYIDTQAPWKLAKQGDTERLGTVLYVLTELLRISAIYLAPIMPASCVKLFDQLGVPHDFRSFASVEQFMPSGAQIGSPQPLFPRIETSDKLKTQVDGSAKGKASAASASREDAAELRRLEEKYGKIACSQQLDRLVKDVGDQIRVLKAEKAEKKALQPLISELNYLKNRLLAVQG